MKLKRNIPELPPLTGRLDRRFALPRALDVFQRISARSGLQRIWGDLPYMRFVQSRSHRPGEAHARPIAPVHQHSNSFHTHIAVSPVIREVVREELQLPVRELDWRAAGAGASANADARNAAATMPATGPAQPRISHLVRVIEERRPETVRAVAIPKQDFARSPVADAPSPLAGEAGSSTESAASAAQPAAPDLSAEDAQTLRTLSNTFDLDALQLNQDARDLLGGDRGSAASMQPILPREIRERLNLDDIEQQEAKRFAARRSSAGRKAAGAGDIAGDGTEPVLETPRVGPIRAKQEQAPRLDYSAEPVQEAVAAARMPGSAPTDLRTSALRPLIEREAPADSAVHATIEAPAAPQESPEEREQRVQATVRETLRSLPEPDVEAFASRVSRSIERRLRIDQEWRGSL